MATPREKVLAGQGITIEEARNVFGSDFTGVQQRGGVYYADTSAVERIGGSNVPAPVPSVPAPSYNAPSAPAPSAPASSQPYNPALANPFYGIPALISSQFTREEAERFQGLKGAAATESSIDQAALATLQRSLTPSELSTYGAAFKTISPEQVSFALQKFSPTLNKGIATAKPAAASPTLFDRVISTPGALAANKEYINAVVKAVTGKDATADQLATYAGQSVEAVKKALIPPDMIAGGAIDTGSPIDVTDAGKGADFEYPQGMEARDATQTAFVEYMKNLIPSLTESKNTAAQARTKIDESMKKFEEISAKQGTQGTRTLELESKYQVPEFLQKANEKADEIQLKIAEYESLYTKLQGQTGVVSGLITGEVAQAQRQKAADIAVLSAQYALYQGKYQTATNLVDRAIKLEFGDIQAQMNSIKTFIDLNRARVSDEEGRQLDIIGVFNDYEHKLLDEQKDIREKNYQLMIDVAKAGGDPDAVDINKSPEENLKSVADLLIEEEVLTPSEARILGVPYGTTRAEAAEMGIVPKYKAAAGGGAGGTNFTSSERKIIQSLTTVSGFRADSLPPEQQLFVVKSMSPTERTAWLADVERNTYVSPLDKETVRSSTDPRTFIQKIRTGKAQKTEEDALETDRFTASSIPPDVMAELMENIQAGDELSTLYTLFPEVSPSLIQSVYYNQ